MSTATTASNGLNAKATTGKLRQYVLGYALSIVTTMTAYLFVTHHVFSGWGLAYAIVSLAVVQMITQLVFFLHVGHESEPRWNLLILDFTLLIVVIVVLGSLWIMNHLNYSMGMSGNGMTNGDMSSNGMQMDQHGSGNQGGMSPQDTENYIVQDEGYHK